MFLFLKEITKVAESKTYKGKKNGYYPETPDRHQGGIYEYMRTPTDTTNTLGMQNEPPAYEGQFGRKDGKSEAR